MYEKEAEVGPHLYRVIQSWQKPVCWVAGSRASTVNSLPVLAEEPSVMAPTTMMADGYGQVQGGSPKRIYGSRSVRRVQETGGLF